MRKKVYAEQGLLLKQDAGPAARNQVQHSMICGSPATVAEEIAKIDKIGVGGLLMVFRMGPMAYDRREQHQPVHEKSGARVQDDRQEACSCLIAKNRNAATGDA